MARRSDAVPPLCTGILSQVSPLRRNIPESNPTDRREVLFTRREAVLPLALLGVGAATTPLVDAYGAERSEVAGAPMSTLAPQRSGQIEVTDSLYGAVGDAVALTDATMRAGSAICTSASNPFNASMVGKTIIVAGAGSAGKKLQATVVSYQGSGQITLSIAASAASTVYGGPNVNAIIGTDNSAAFAAAFNAASGAASMVDSNRRRYQPVDSVFMPGGNYLVMTGVPPLQVAGITVIGSGIDTTRIWHCGDDPFLQMGSFDSSSDDAFGGNARRLRVSHLTLSAPIDMGGRSGIGIQDNGSGELFIDNVEFSGFQYGVFATSGSDFSRFGNNVYFRDCDVGMYLGPGSQQVLIYGVDFANCKEGLVNEGAMQGVIIGCSFENNDTADITYDGTVSGLTRSGLPCDINGAYYFGAWTHVGCWFETGAGVVSNRNNSHNIWIKSTGSPRGWTGLRFSNCMVVSGGREQEVGGTNAFISDIGTRSANPVIEGLQIIGNSINGVYFYHGPDATSGPVFKDWNAPGGGVTPTLGESSGSPISVPDSAGNTSITLAASANAVNSLAVTNSQAGAPIELSPHGPDTDTNILLRPKGGGYVAMVDASARSIARFVATPNPVNHIEFSSSDAGSAVALAAKGGDANVSLNLIPLGDGLVQAGGHPVGVKVTVPASANAAGVVGQWAADESWIYVVIAENTWVRAPLATW